MTVSLSDRARRVAERAGIQAPNASPSEKLAGEPDDLAALWAVTDGLELGDGTRILPRGEVTGATAWLVSDRALEWGSDLWVIGERDDLVIIRDLDAEGARAGGGVIEAPTDGLSTLTRVAMDVLGYLEDRLGIARGGDAAPERAAREAMAKRDADGIAKALARGFYPGSDREASQAWVALGAIHAGAGDVDRAMDAFTSAVRARVRSVPRGAEASEAASAWRACAVAAEKAGAKDIAEACRRRGQSGAAL